ncbi:serine/threonine-protein kinase SRPK3 [Purpureocillium lavendulum]|uniref:non-specific serine/threonine protein kinase n=1 Tax=Purpureocillium lavendulum TaxID=1247861 RepID=A0AB34G194_9HYPO|nr:serine/threonine-protein kinase SRPK3 [Purpureocillium lavendulum]
MDTRIACGLLPSAAPRMASVLRWARALARKAPLAPLRFPSSGFTVIDSSVLLEEERFEGFAAGDFYPVNIGDVLASRYQVLGKLGFGSTSTVWLARNLVNQEHVALKVCTRDLADGHESKILEAIAKANPSHPGYRYVRTALETLQLERPGGGDHCCIVQRPMWDSWSDLVRWNDSGLFSEDLLKAGLRCLFLALDYLHSECRLVHTDIKADNILQGINDKRILEAFTQAELATPAPRKTVGGVTIYASRRFGLPRTFGEPVLSDFGAAVQGDLKRDHDAQPAVYRSPEVMLGTEWSYPVDIWNPGANEARNNTKKIWDLFEGRHLFHGNDPADQMYSTRAHLAEVIGLLGAPPVDLLRRGRRSREFFAEDGTWIADVRIPSGMSSSLDTCEMRLEGDSRKRFLGLVRGMLQWRPEDRKTAKQLLQDPWINS